MNIYAFFLGILFAYDVVALPAVVADESILEKARENRQNEEVAAMGTPAIAAKTMNLPALPDELPITSLPTVDADKSLDVISQDGAADAVERVKKQACLQMPCGTRSMCTGLPCGLPAAKSANSQEQVVMELKPQIMPGARTIEPVISFGPVSVNSPGGFSSSASSGYGSNIYAVPTRQLTSGSYGPSAMQFSAVVPVMHHRHPLIHHNMELSHNLGYESRPDVLYYNAPEPIYVAAPVNTVAEESAHQAPLALFCENLKKKEGKALEERANFTEEAAKKEEDSINEHIARVNEIKEEITQLNNAAQRIVDQQERLARLHQDHMSMIAAKSADPYPPHMRSFEPLMRHHESHMRMPYGMYGGGYMRPPFFKSAEEPTSSTPAPVSTATPDEPSKPESQEGRSRGATATATAYSSYSHPQTFISMRSPDDYMRQGYYPSYGGYYGYRAEPAYMSQPPYYQEGRSATGLQVPSIFGRSSGDQPTQEETKQLFMRMVEMGQKMGVVPKDFQNTLLTTNDKNKNEEPTKSEDVFEGFLSDSYKKSSDPSKIDLPQVDSSSGGKKDKRGLIQKNKQ